MTYTGRRTSPLPPGWGSIRRRILSRDPTCQLQIHCTGAPTTEVDHRGDPDDHRDHMLQGVCAPCHATKTGQQANAAKPKRRRPNDQRHPGTIDPPPP